MKALRIKGIESMVSRPTTEESSVVQYFKHVVALFLPSFPRRRESISDNWTPAFAGMTNQMIISEKI